MHPPREGLPHHFWTSGWPETLASFLAAVGLIVAVFIGFKPYSRQNAGSDFKTLYASTWCFSHHLDAYQFPNLAAVFHANAVVEPQSWYGHAPVYPPFTLALLGPLAAVPMVPATCLWIVASGLLLALATAALARSAARVFALPLPYRLAIVGLVMGSPLVSLGLELGNVSVVVVALCILALTATPQSSAWLPAIGLVAALILKPHIAFWAVLAILLSRSSFDRDLLKKTAQLTSATLGIMLAWMLQQHILLSQTASYRAMVLAELSNGSMAPGNRDLMEIVVQITSFAHLLGYLLTPGTLASFANILVLITLAALLVWSALRLRRVSSQARFVIAPAVFAFGLLATYHREADSMLLVFLLPLVLARLHSKPTDLWAWTASALLLAGSVGPSLAMLRWLAERDGVYTAIRFLALRQAAIVNLCLALMLIGAAAIWSNKQPTQPSASAIDLA